MLFNALPFLLFLPCVWLLYRLTSHRWQNLVLLSASYFFYGCWDWRFLSLLWLSTVVDFFCALEMQKRPDKKRLFLSVSLLTNLGILGTFKYCGFFLQSLTRLLTSLGIEAHPPLLELILPVGISFYTFQTLAYSIDVYRGRQQATTDISSFALYVAYFPQLVAGPIERSTDLLPQFQKKRTVTRSDLSSGLELCLLGFFKKVSLADGVAPIATEIFNNCIAA